MASQTICTIEQLAPLLAARATRFHATSRVVARRCPPARSRRARLPFPRRAVHARGMSDPSSSSGGDAAGDRVMADASRALTAYAGVPTSVASGDAQGEVRPAPTGFHRASAASSNPDRFPSRVRRPFDSSTPRPPRVPTLTAPSPPSDTAGLQRHLFASTTPRRGGGRLQRSPIRQQGRPRRRRRARRRARRRRAHRRRDRFFQRPRRRRRVRRRPSRRRRHRGRRADRPRRRQHPRSHR